jgi:hypothetical protein
MTEDRRKYQRSAQAGGGCDVRVWSGSCEQNEVEGGVKTYLCASCGTIPNLNHEVHHEMFPHVCGDEDNLY